MPRSSFIFLNRPAVSSSKAMVTLSGDFISSPAFLSAGNFLLMVYYLYQALSFYTDAGTCIPRGCTSPSFRADGLPGLPTLFLWSDIVKFQREIIL
jgi:hypothetical protein